MLLCFRQVNVLLSSLKTFSDFFGEAVPRCTACNVVCKRMQVAGGQTRANVARWETPKLCGPISSGDYSVILEGRVWSVSIVEPRRVQKLKRE